MKNCPTCHRTFDNTLTFCLVDGSILSAPFDPEATVHLPASDKTEPPPTEVIHALPKTASLPLTQAAKADVYAAAMPIVASAPQKPQTKRLIWLLSGSLAVLIIGIIVVSFAVRNSRSRENVNANTPQSNRSMAGNKNPLSNKDTNRNTNSSAYNFTREEFEDYKNYYVSEARKRGSNIGAGTDDLFIWAKILRKFEDARDDELNKIVIDVDEGKVTLRGGSSLQAKAKAEQIVRGVEGVKGINNQIAVT